MNIFVRVRGIDARQSDSRRNECVLAIYEWPQQVVLILRVANLRSLHVDRNFKSNGKM